MREPTNKPESDLSASLPSRTDLRLQAKIRAVVQENPAVADYFGFFDRESTRSESEARGNQQLVDELRDGCGQGSDLGEVAKKISDRENDSPLDR